jgi:hypothetical protein
VGDRGKTWLIRSDTIGVTHIDLTFADLVKLMHGKLEKNGVTITFRRPVLTKVTGNPLDKSGEITFFLDEADERSSGAWNA